MAKLIALTGKDAGFEFAIHEGESIIGRGLDTTVCLMDKRSSRRHCRLVMDGGGYRLEDLRSRNGTFLNGQQVSGMLEVKPGDHFRVGKTMMELSAAAVDKRKEAPPAAIRQAEITIEGSEDENTIDDSTVGIAHLLRRLVGMRSQGSPGGRDKRD